MSDMMNCPHCGTSQPCVTQIELNEGSWSCSKCGWDGTPEIDIKTTALRCPNCETGELVSGKCPACLYSTPFSRGHTQGYQVLWPGDGFEKFVPAEGPRYKVVPESVSAHCCFEATVVDTHSVQWCSFKVFRQDNGEPYYWSLCECFELADAEAICARLNASNDGTNYMGHLTDTEILDEATSRGLVTDKGEDCEPQPDEPGLPRNWEQPSLEAFVENNYWYRPEDAIGDIRRYISKHRTEIEGVHHV